MTPLIGFFSPFFTSNPALISTPKSPVVRFAVCVPCTDFTQIWFPSSSNDLTFPSLISIAKFEISGGSE